MADRESRWSLATLLNFRGKVRRKPLQQARSVNPYHAVSVIPGSKACDAAHRFAGKRFLSRQAPRLPLPSCDVQQCTCRFKHYADRRRGPRRAGDIGVVTVIWNGTERRQRGGRRTTDR